MVADTRFPDDGPCRLFREFLTTRAGTIDQDLQRAKRVAPIWMEFVNMNLVKYIQSPVCPSVFITYPPLLFTGNIADGNHRILAFLGYQECKTEYIRALRATIPLTKWLVLNAGMILFGMAANPFLTSRLFRERIKQTSEYFKRLNYQQERAETTLAGSQ